MMQENFDFSLFKKEYIKEVRAEGGNISITANDDFIISIPITDYPSGNMVWEKGNLQQKYEEFLQYAKKQDDTDFVL